MRRNPPLPTSAQQRAQQLRRAATEVESKLWLHLRAGRLGGLKFRRQHPIPPYVVDFCCLPARLIVELDGSQHETSLDARRELALRTQGFELLRFWNDDVLQRLEQVLEQILTAAIARTLTPSPSPGGRGEQAPSP